MICATQSDWGDWRKGLQALFPLWRNAVTSSVLPDRFLLWVDAVGGYLVCLRDEVTIGRPSSSGLPDVPILGDLARRHAVIRREGETYSIEAVRPVSVDGQLVPKTAPLLEGSERDYRTVPPSAEIAYRTLKATVDRLHALNKRVVLVAPPPGRLGFSLAGCQERRLTGLPTRGAPERCEIDQNYFDWFQTSVSALLAKVKVGDKVRFAADKIDGTYTVTAIEPAR